MVLVSQSPKPGWVQEDTYECQNRARAPCLIEDRLFTSLGVLFFLFGRGAQMVVFLLAALLKPAQQGVPLQIDSPICLPVALTKKQKNSPTRRALKKKDRSEQDGGIQLELSHFAPPHVIRVLSRCPPLEESRGAGDLPGAEGKRKPTKMSHPTGKRVVTLVVFGRVWSAPCLRLVEREAKRKTVMLIPFKQRRINIILPKFVDLPSSFVWLLLLHLAVFSMIATLHCLRC